MSIRSQFKSSGRLREKLFISLELFLCLSIIAYPASAQTAEPTIQTSAFQFTVSAANSYQISWTNGNGSSRVVLARDGAAINQQPVDGVTYAASSTFGSGHDLGASNFTVYNGTGNSFILNGLAAGKTYHFESFEYNGSAGSENYLLSTVSGNPTSYNLPFVAANSTPGTIAPNTEIPVSANFTASGVVTSAKIYYRPVAGVAPNNYIVADMTPPAVGVTYTFTIPSTAVTELGVEYNFLITDGYGNTNFAARALYETRIRHLQGNAQTLSIPYADPGSDVTNYRIIAIPVDLDSKSVNSVFSDTFGAYDPTLYTLYRWEGGPKYVELNGNTQFELGKGYWYLTPISTPVYIGPGTTAVVSTGNPFQITLAPGWNQIGNPYNFNISWSDILTANPTKVPNLGNNSKIRVFRGTVSDVDELQKFEGGFVKNTSTSNLIIDIPVAKNLSINGRKGQPEEMKNSIGQPEWEIMFNLKEGKSEYRLGGLGMHPEASIDFDFHDDFNLPRFFDYLEIKFPKKRVGMTYTKDVVPTAENFVWEFTVESNLKEKEISIRWDNSYFGNVKEVYLLDVASHRITDMLAENHYDFSHSSTKEFKVVYGNPDFVKKELVPNRIVLHDPYPNPFTDRATIEYALPPESVTMNTEIGIYNAWGAKVSSIVAPRQSGVGRWVWEADSNASGLYFIRLRMGDQVITKKLLKR